MDQPVRCLHSRRRRKQYRFRALHCEDIFKRAGNHTVRWPSVILNTSPGGDQKCVQSMSIRCFSPKVLCKEVQAGARRKYNLYAGTLYFCLSWCLPLTSAHIKRSRVTIIKMAAISLAGGRRPANGLLLGTLLIRAPRIADRDVRGVRPVVCCGDRRPNGENAGLRSLINTSRARQRRNIASNPMLPHLFQPGRRSRYLLGVFGGGGENHHFSCALSARTP